MILSSEMGDDVQKLIHDEAMDVPGSSTLSDLCRKLKVAKLYYDLDLGGDDRYRNHRTGRLVLDADEVDKYLILYDSGRKSGIKLKYKYFYSGLEYVHAIVEFEEDVKEEDIDQALYSFLADVVYILYSRRNMRKMLDHAEASDALTGIPNISYVQRKYEKAIQTISPEDLVVIRMNLKNFQYINEVLSAKVGDEAIIQYARKLLNFVEDDECAERMGGDNFIVFIRKDNLKPFLKKIDSVVISRLKSAPSNRFEVSAWVGVSKLDENENKPFLERMHDASVACSMGKGRLKKSVVYYGDDLKQMIVQGRDVIAAFPGAIRDHEFTPFFQPKVDMRSGELAGFEALCRWIHDGQFIFPDQFIPTLDREGLIPKLDMAIFDETCRAIRRWKDMGLNPPRISSNFSKKNLFVPRIEEKIFEVIRSNGLEPSDVEIEITESMKDIEYDRLIQFVKKIKEQDVSISIDDFGTGYSSLSLIHNIEADVIKIDKSFTDQLPDDSKSAVLIESIIAIAEKLGISTIAEGVETKEQGAALLEMGCNFAQGYYYSKPVDYETATKMIMDRPFEPIRQEG